MRLEIDNLEISYPNSDFHIALDNFSLDYGEKCGIIGASGCGKSSLVNAIAGLLPVLSGDIKFQTKKGEGKLFEPLKMSRKELRKFRFEKIGLVYQNFELIPYLSLLDNIILKNRISSKIGSLKEAKFRAIHLIKEAGLTHRLNQKVELLSQGEMQRTALCRALLNSPEIIIADEPTANLDPDSANLMVKMLEDYIDKSGSTLLMVTHNHSLLKGMDSVLTYSNFSFIQKKGAQNV